MLDVDFVLTCFDREAYAPCAVRLIRSYRRVRPRVVLVYNGRDPDFPCDVRLPDNPGLHAGDHAMTLAGARLCPGRRVVKLSVDTWLADEAVILRTFAALAARRAPYAGNRWIPGEPALATDVVFADRDNGDLFEGLTLGPGEAFERAVWRRVAELGRGWVGLPERDPVHPDRRFECRPLGLTAHHDLGRNLANLRAWNPAAYAACVGEAAEARPGTGTPSAAASPLRA